MPAGLLYEREFITTEEEEALLAGIRGLDLQEAKYKAYTARRRIAVFGTAYDFETYQLGAAPPMPPFLHPLRDKVARSSKSSRQHFRMR